MTARPRYIGKVWTPIGDGSFRQLAEYPSSTIMGADDECRRFCANRDQNTIHSCVTEVIRHSDDHCSRSSSYGEYGNIQRLTAWQCGVILPQRSDWSEHAMFNENASNYWRECYVIKSPFRMLVQDWDDVRKQFDAVVRLHTAMKVAEVKRLPDMERKAWGYGPTTFRLWWYQSQGYQFIAAGSV